MPDDIFDLVLVDCSAAANVSIHHPSVFTRTARNTLRRSYRSGSGDSDSTVSHEIISPKTRLEFREYFVSTSVARVDDAFALAGIPCREEFEPPLTGARRSRVEQYYVNLDFSRQSDAHRVLVVYEHVLDDLEHQVAHGDDYSKQYATSTLDSLLRCVRRDGFHWVDGHLVPAAKKSQLRDLHDAITAVNAPEFAQQLARLRQAVDDDPGLAIGTAKEILETTCKTILEDEGVSFDAGSDLPELLKATRKKLKLLPDDIPQAAKGAATIKRLLSSLGQIGSGLAELRNLYGSGHGRSARSKGLSTRHARLAVGAVATLVQFLFDTHRERRTQ